MARLHNIDMNRTRVRFKGDKTKRYHTFEEAVVLNKLKTGPLDGPRPARSPARDREATTLSSNFTD